MSAVEPRPIVQAVVENTLVRVWFSFERGDARLRAVPVVLHREDLFRAGHPQDLPDEFALPEAVSVDKSVSPMFMGFVGTRACTARIRADSAFAEIERAFERPVKVR